MKKLFLFLYVVFCCVIKQDGYISELTENEILSGYLQDEVWKAFVLSTLVLGVGKLAKSFFF